MLQNLSYTTRRKLEDYLLESKARITSRELGNSSAIAAHLTKTFSLSPPLDKVDVQKLCRSLSIEVPRGNPDIGSIRNSRNSPTPPPTSVSLNPEDRKAIADLTAALLLLCDILSSKKPSA